MKARSESGVMGTGVPLAMSLAMSLGAFGGLLMTSAPLGAFACENDTCNTESGNCNPSDVTTNCDEVLGGCKSSVCS